MTTKEYVREKTGRMIPCPGEAHKNGHIDNCEVCAPRWGEVYELAPVDLAKAQVDRLDIDVAMLDVAGDDAMVHHMVEGRCSLVSKSETIPGATRHYWVYRWT